MMDSNFKRNKQAQYDAPLRETTPSPNQMQFEDQSEEEINILNEETVNIQGMTPQAAMFLSAADHFETALKMLVIEENNNIVCKKLQIIQNKIRKKIYSLKKKTEEKDTDPESGRLSSTKIVSTSTLSLCSLQSEKESSPRKGDLSSSKILTTSTQSLSTIESTKNVIFETNGKFQIFLESVNCPFCLKREDDKNSLIKHLSESCDALRKKKFVQSSHTPYSVFQILPNNTFKCNICVNSVQRDLKHYFIHCQKKGHVFAYERASSGKSYTDFLFCAPCKIQIPNNATEIKFHIDHEAHQIRCGRILNVYSLMRSGIACVYLRDKKFKCLNCPAKHSLHQNAKEILEHFASKVHKKHLKQNIPPNFSAVTKSKVHCLFCCEAFDVYNVVSHLKSKSHILIEEKEESENRFQLCLYCGFKCASLHELALHMESQCAEIDVVRQSSLEKVEDRVKNSKRAPLQNEAETNPGKKERWHIIVQGHGNVVELFNYFNKIGEIAELDASHEKGVLIKFKEEKTVDDVLLLRQVIAIDGVKVKILVGNEESVGDDSVKRKTETDVLAVPERNNRTETSTLKEWKATVTVPRNNIPEKSSSKILGFSNTAMDNLDIDNLIKRVCVHLESATFNLSRLRTTAFQPYWLKILYSGTVDAIQATNLKYCHIVGLGGVFLGMRLEPKEKEKITNDCRNVLKLAKFHEVGFSICGLMFPVEEISFYCEIEGDLFNVRKSEFCLIESESFNKRMIQECKALLGSSNFFTRVQTSSCTPLCVEFQHRETKRACTITFRASSKLLTDLLRNLQVNFVRPFILLIRFWLSVHELEIRHFQYALISLLAFFLVRENAARHNDILEIRDCHKLLRNRLASKGLPTEVPTPCSQPEPYNVKELYSRFLLFLNSFDFEKNAICLPLWVPVPKDLLLEERVRSYLSNYDLKSNNGLPLVIMDPFLHTNLAADVKKEDFKSLLRIVRQTIDHYNIR